MTKNLADMTPVEIDTLLAPIWEREYAAKSDILATTRRSGELQVKASKLKNGIKVQGYQTPGDGIRLAETIQHLNNRITSLHEILAQIAEEAAPYEEEYRRRGGWTRVFLANSSDGHAHKGTECSTCHHGEYRTSFSWLIQYSGLPESAIVADAGERACTTCYPSAPVNVLKQKTKMFTPDEVEAQQAREAREAARAQRSSAKAAKAIVDVDGSPLRGRSRDIVETERAAQILAVDAIKEALKLWESMVLEPLFEAHEGLRETDWFRLVTDEEQAKEQELADRLVAALAAKQNRDKAEVFEELKIKAVAKVKREKNEILKNTFMYMRGMPQYKAYVKAAEAKGLKPWNPLSK